MTAIKEELIKTGSKIIYVSFDFGSMVYVTVTLYEGKTLEECIRLRSERIDGYITNGKYHKLKA